MLWVFSTPLHGVDNSMVIVIIYHLYTEGQSWSWLYYSWIHNYICNQCISPLTLGVRITLMRGVLDILLCDKVYKWPAAGRWHPPVSFNKTYRHDIDETLLKVALNNTTLFSDVSLNESQSQKTMFNNTLFRTELFAQLVFGKSRCESESNPNPYKVKVMVYLLPIKLFKPVDTKKDDWDQGSLSFYFVCHRKAVMSLTWAMSFIKFSQM